MIYGTTSRNLPSRFVTEIPQSLCDVTSAFRKPAAAVPVKPAQSSGYDYKNVFRRPTPVQTAPSAASSSNYSAGMRVEHKTFGVGMITGVTPMGNDAMLEIAFENVGTKKIMAGYAKLTIL